MKSQMKKKQTMQLMEREGRKKSRNAKGEKVKLKIESPVESDIDNLDDIQSLNHEIAPLKEDTSPTHVFRVGGTRKPQPLAIAPLIE